MPPLIRIRQFEFSNLTIRKYKPRFNTSHLWSLIFGSHLRSLESEIDRVLPYEYQLHELTCPRSSRCERACRKYWNRFEVCLETPSRSMGRLERIVGRIIFNRALRNASENDCGRQCGCCCYVVSVNLKAGIDEWSARLSLHPRVCISIAKPVGRHRINE